MALQSSSSASERAPQHDGASGERWCAANVGRAAARSIPALGSKESSMPLVTLTIREGKSREFKSVVLDAVHGALTASGVPEKDRLQRVLELSADNFRFDTEYPDLTARRTDDFG